MDFTTATPVEIDTHIAELQMKQIPHQAEITRQHRYAASKGAQPSWEDYSDHYDEAKLQAALAAHNALEVVIDECQNEYIARGRWPRYFHVTNKNGHIHNSLHCSSCFPDTTYSWRTDLSGLSEHEVVEREAYNACSVCMPIAPAEQKAARERYNKEQREARKAEKDAKKAAKDAKSRERARKLVDKVVKEIDKMGGLDAFNNDYSLNGHDGKKSVYDAIFDMQQTVGDVLYEMKQRQEEGRSHHRMNEFVKAELTERGLI
jgi:pyrroloquinoline quinone (PQQ) biosynthesis protein C